MTAYRRNEDGSLTPAEPFGFQPGLDVERYADGRWELFDGDRLIAKGRTRIGLIWAAQRATRRLRKEAR